MLIKFKIPVLNSIIYFFEKRAFGVSEWWGDKLNINPIIVRKFFIYLSFITLGSPVLIYFIMAFILENKSIFKFRQKRKTVWDLK